MTSEPKVIYQDKNIAVLEKPAGWVVNRTKSAKGPILQDWVERNLPLSVIPDPPMRRSPGSTREVFFERSGIAHRLDKETSGLILVALSPDILESLLAQFKKREIQKSYICLVHGRVAKPVLPAGRQASGVGESAEEAEGVINEPLGRDPFNPTRFTVLSEGRESITNYQVLSYYSSPSKHSREQVTLIKVKPLTGRTHQIRVHFKYIGHPLVSDPLYAGRKTYRKDLLFCPRLFLHAQSLTFKHPSNGKVLSFQSELPEDLKEVLARMSIV